MPSGNWSFPCSPRNPAKVREELRLLATLIPSWRARGLPWSPRSGAQLEFGHRLRLMADEPPSLAPAGPRHQAAELGPSWEPLAAEAGDEPTALRFQTQSPVLSDDHLRWTARARFGTYKFFGFACVDAHGYAQLTPAGERFITSPRPGEVLLRQLLKWQYPDNQHRGRRWPAEDFAIYPFIATARLIAELDGLTKREIALFCFTMRRTEDAAATAEAIRQLRARESLAVGRAGKARARRHALHSARARSATEGHRVVASMDDYADALVRYFRYTGLFSVRGARIVVASGREAELEELIYDAPSPSFGTPHPSKEAPLFSLDGRGGQGARSSHPIQLALGETPPVRLAQPRPLFAEYADAERFYAYYGDPSCPRLPWESPSRLQEIARTLDAEIAVLSAREARRRTGRAVLTGPQLPATLPDDYETLVSLVDRLRRRKLRLEHALYAAESRTPQRLREALDFYDAILAREVIDPPTFLEWNTWRVFLALDQAREIVPHLALDDDLQPLSPAQGNQPDLEIDYGSFVVVAEVTLRTGADQRQAEARPVTRHVLEAQRRYEHRSPGRSEAWAGGRPREPSGSGEPGRPGERAASEPVGPDPDALAFPVYGLFLAPRIHADTAVDFFVALKHRVIERRRVVAIPLTLRQLTTALHPFTGAVAFAPHHLRHLLDAFVARGLEAETGDEWLEAIDVTLRHWLAALGVSATPPRSARAMPLPLFGAPSFRVE
jgi:hypothetical protein